VDLCECVEDAPCLSLAECRMCRVSPLLENIWDLRGGDRLAINRTDHDVVGSGIVEHPAFVGIQSTDQLIEHVA